MYKKNITCGEPFTGTRLLLWGNGTDLFYSIKKKLISGLPRATKKYYYYKTINSMFQAFT
jgi:hypothetical protein